MDSSTLGGQSIHDREILQHHRDTGINFKDRIQKPTGNKRHAHSFASYSDIKIQHLILEIHSFIQLDDISIRSKRGSQIILTGWRDYQSEIIRIALTFEIIDNVGD
ncbi:hypothetical protein [Rubritalea sp.]|uniref:hypothetical protein n=1 Tax=Rubritalea sp. TaxID=2109375 RepID=UPI003EF840CC